MDLHILADDLDGRREDGVERHTLTIDEETRVVDLHDDNFKELQSAIKKYFDAGRPVSQTARGTKAHLQSVPAGRTPARTDSAQLQRMREWLWAHPEALKGRELKKHGRIPAVLQKAYHELAGKSPATAETDAPVFSGAK